MTERPGFGLQVAPDQQSNSNARRVVPSNNDNLPLETLFDDENSVDEIEGPSGPSGPSGTGIGNIKMTNLCNTPNNFRVCLCSTKMS